MPFYNLPSVGMETGTNTVTISSGQTASGALDLRGRAFVGFIMPAAFTGSSVTFQGSADGTNFYALYNSDNTQFSITVSTSRYYCLNPADFLGMQQLKIVSGSAEGADRDITIVTRSAV